MKLPELDDDVFAEEIRELRPVPSESFSVELDRLAASGFDAGRRSPFARLRGRLALNPIRAAVPAGALASLAVAAIVSAAVLSEDDPVATQDEGAAAGLAIEETVPQEGAPAPPLVPVPEAAPTIALDAADIDRSAGAASIAAPSSGAGGLAPGEEKRQVDRNAFLTLSTQPEDVRETTDEAVSIARSLGGIIVSSQVREGSDGASATIEISLPTRNLDAALDRLTELGNVEALNESTLDITKPFVSAKDRIRDARAERRAILDALAATKDPATITELRREANRARLEISRARADFENIARQARLSNISLEIDGDPEASDDWSLSEALEDAKDVLRTAAGIALVTAAIMVPLALLILLVALAVRVWRGGARNRALDE